MSKREIKIHCPKCDWEPRNDSRWFCGGCGHSWNTFDTAATCPECGTEHRETQCLSCHSHSPHSHWYHEFNHREDEEVVVEAIGQTVETR